MTCSPSPQHWSAWLTHGPTEPRASGLRGAQDSGLSATTRVLIEEILGWKLDDGKKVVDATTTTILGVLTSFCQRTRCLRFEIDDEHLRKWRECITSILDKGSLAPAAARKLAGKLGWATQQVFGRAARVWLAPLHHHAVGCGAVRTALISGRAS